MKIVHVTEDFSKNNTGITASILEYSRAALAAGHQVEVVTPGGVPSVDVRGLSIRSGNCSWLAAPWRYWNDFERQLKLAVGEKGIVHVHGIWMYPQFRAVSTSLKHGWPVVITPHNMLGGWLWNRGSFRRAKKWLYFELVARRVFQRANVVHALSEIERSVLATDFFQKTPVIIIPNAVNLSSLDSGISLADQRLLPDEKTILFLGRLHPVKGINLLIDAFSRINVSCGSKLVIAGPPSDLDYENQLKLQVRSLNLEKSVSFVGPVYGVAKQRLLSSAWVMCTPSYSEGMSMAALEAMASSTPVITTPGAGLDDIDRAGGVLVESDAAAISKALNLALGWNISERMERGKRAKMVVAKNYSWQAIWPRYEELYASLIR